MLSKINLGVKHILIAGFFFAAINALVKYYAHIPAIEIVFFRSVVTLILSSFWIIKAKESIFPAKTTYLLVARGLSGGLALILYFSTLQTMPLATAVTILYLAPIFTLIFATFLVKEPPKKWQWPFMFLGFLGAAIMKSFDARIATLDLLKGVIAAMFAGLAYNIIRMLKGRAHHQLIIFYFPLITIPLTLPWLFKEWVTPSFTDTLGLIAIGIATQLAQVHMTQAYMLEKASRIGHFNYLTSLYAVICGILFFGEILSLANIFGMLLIMFGVLMSSKISMRN